MFWRLRKELLEDDSRCPRYHAPWQMVVVRGHEQCNYCKSNVLECCSGEICEPTTLSSKQSVKSDVVN